MTMISPGRRRGRRTVPVRRRRRRGAESRTAGTGRRRRGTEARTAGTRRRRRGTETRTAGTGRRRRGTEARTAGTGRRRRGTEARAAGAAAWSGNLGYGTFFRGGVGCSRPAQDGDSRSDKNDTGQSLLIHGETSLSAIVQRPQDTGELDFGKYQSPLLAAAPISTPRRSMRRPEARGQKIPKAAKQTERV